MEYKDIKIGREAVEGRTITGYASVFGNKDWVRDIVEAGAFKKTLSERFNQIKVYYNHSTPLGMPVKIMEDAKGLYTESTVSKTAKGDEVLTLIKDGVIDTMSIAYDVINYEPLNDGGRRIKEVRLFEYGPVDFAANESAVITGVKSLIANLKDREITDSNVEEIKQTIQMLETMLKYKKGEPSEDTHAEPLENTLVKSLYEIKSTYFEQLVEALKR